MRTVRIFISSPGDVIHERLKIKRVIERLNGEYATVARFEPILWETRFYGAHASFQDEIPQAKSCDIVIGTLWSRLGTALPETFERMPSAHAIVPDEPYPSGTAFEVLSSIFERQARATEGARARPDVYVFRKTEPPVIRLGSVDAIADAQGQWQRLEAFFQRWFKGDDGVVRAAHHTFASADDLERQVDAMLRAWIRDNLEGAAAIVWPASRGSPFRGLAAFDASHAAVFFGRDRKVNRAMELLKDAATAAAQGTERASPRDRLARPFLLIVGPSGSGKSSLMRAGLAPRLTSPGVVPSVDLWRTAVLKPGDAETPLLALATALTRAAPSSAGEGSDDGFGAALPELSGSQPSTALLAAELEQAPDQAAARVVGVLDAVGEAERVRERYERRWTANLLLLVDQLDDIFTASVEPQAGGAFAKALAALAATQRVWIAATLRGDLYEALISERAWIALKDSGATYDLAPPGPEELEEIVRKSAAAAGLVYDNDPRSGLPLDMTLLADAKGGHDVLPLLQFTLNRLYEDRVTSEGATLLTFEAYRRMGGLDGAIDEAAEQALEELPEATIEALPPLLRQLVVPVESRGGIDGSEIALSIRAADLDQLQRDPHVAALAAALIQARILQASSGDGGTGRHVRLAHQRVLESWGRARSLIAAQRDFYRIRDDVEKQHQRWQASGRRRQLLIPPGIAIAEAEKIGRDFREELPEPVLSFIELSGRRARLRHRVLTAATVTFAVVAAVAVWQTQVATEARDSAEKNFETAVTTVDDNIKLFAGRLQRIEDIRIDTVKAAFDELDRSVTRLAERAGQSSVFDRIRADHALEFAKINKQAGSPEALRLATVALDGFEALARRYPGEKAYRVRQSDAYDVISDLKRTVDPAGSRAAVESALLLRRTLAEKWPDDPSIAQGLSKTLVRVGDLERQVTRNFAAAADRYREGYDLALKWFLDNPDDASWQRELSWVVSKLGDQKLQGRTAADWRAALALFEQELCLKRRLSERDSVDTLYQSDVSWALERVGRAHERLGELAQAEQAFLEAIGLRRVLRTRNPDSEVWLRDLYVIITRFGQLKLQQQSADVAFVYLAEAQRVFADLKRQGGVQNWLPRYGPAMDAARLEIGATEAGAALRNLDAVINAAEADARRRYELNRPRSEACWARLPAQSDRDPLVRKKQSAG